MGNHVIHIDIGIVQYAERLLHLLAVGRKLEFKIGRKLGRQPDAPANNIVPHYPWQQRVDFSHRFFHTH
jgi:hypothetical protein